MSTIMNPVGPQPASVYWRRRIVVGLGLLAVIAIIVLIVFRPGGDDTATAPSPEPTDPAVTASEDPTAAVDDCDPLDIVLEPVTDKNIYAAGEFPQISIRVTNTGSSACSVNLGSTEQEMRITSGSDSIWSSRDCQTEPEDAVRELDAGASIDLPGIPWDRTRSSTTTCDTTRSQVGAGGASYHLKVYLGEVESESTKQFILN